MLIYYDNCKTPLFVPTRNSVEKSIQVRVFKEQLYMANESGMSLVIHCRDAEQDVFEIMKEVYFLYSLSILLKNHLFLNFKHLIEPR